MELAKQHIDVGLFTNRAAELMPFWQGDVGLPFEEMLPTGGGTRQQRHAMNGSVFKLNDVRDPMPATALSGYRELFIARDGLAESERLVDPEGNVVTLVRPGEDGITGIAISVAASDAAAFDDFYMRICGFERVEMGRYRCGDTLLFVHEDKSAGRDSDLRGTGYRYLTVQIRDCDAEHRGLLERGATEGRPPITLGTTARFSFIRDPDGNWIEISQRASLTGPLPQ